jgi:acyl carrier protein
LQEELGRVLKLAPARIDRGRALGTMGLDSLMALEFVRRLGATLGIAIPATAVFNYPTIELLAGNLIRKMRLEPEAPQANPQNVSAPPIPVSGLGDELTELEAVRALMGKSEGRR